jgi:hypothetical protein
MESEAERTKEVKMLEKAFKKLKPVMKRAQKFHTDGEVEHPDWVEILIFLSTENLIEHSKRLTCLTWGLIIFAIAQIVVVVLVGIGCIS